MSLTHHNENYSHGGETKKIFCAYHRTQFLTNFCLQKECLMPLCPSCVAQHTEQHYQSSQKPTYINLNEGLHDVKQKCYSFIVSLEQYSKNNDDLIAYINSLASNIHEQLQQNKQQIYVKIQQIFNSFQQRLLREVEDHYRNNLVYDMEQGQIIKQYVSQRIQMLYDKIGMLKGDQCLAALIKFYDHEQQQYESQLKDVSEYIAKHKRVGQAKLSLNHELMNERFEDLCDHLLILSYSSDLDQDYQKNNSRQSKYKKLPFTPSNTNPNMSMTPLAKQKSDIRQSIPNQTIRNSVKKNSIQSRFAKVH